MYRLYFVDLAKKQNFQPGSDLPVLMMDDLGIVNNTSIKTHKALGTTLKKRDPGTNSKTSKKSYISERNDGFENNICGVYILIQLSSLTASALYFRVSFEKRKKQNQRKQESKKTLE
ncbi:hypothetical protein Glove_208g133 [Diversispora epigaea]|uniref:Uncharacterized protein n=1 Tax=Diversispora epigaea TaxID=1348612 RepID=A0A397IIZ4_9GLOM|nr:hypothetical protein Glove_208g133 [Diversispora epigaea]